MFTSATAGDRARMLCAIGVESIDQLYADVPSQFRLTAPLDLPAAASEDAVLRTIASLAADNASTDEEVSFLGAGAYDHYVPAVVDAFVNRAEFLTPYTPYQPEIAQGNLQVMFEYQTAICELTGMEVSNASIYDGASAVAAAAWMAKLATGRPRVVVSSVIHPHALETLRTHAKGYGMEVVVAARDGARTDPDALATLVDEHTAAIIVAQPTFLGGLEPLGFVAESAHAVGALAVCACDPMTLGVLRPPGDCGFDIVVGDGQGLGNGLNFGGPSFGFFAANECHVRLMPGRIAGETLDRNDRRGFVTTFQTREQHIRRERATSNICTSQALCTLGAIVYLSWLGPQGLAEIGDIMVQRTAYARERLCSLPGVTPLDVRPAVREFAVQLDVDGLDGVRRVIADCREGAIHPGYAVGESIAELGDTLLVALTERRTRTDIDRLCNALGAAVEREQHDAMRSMAAA